MSQSGSTLEKYSAIAGIVSGALAVIGFMYSYVINDANAKKSDDQKIAEEINISKNQAPIINPLQDLMTKVFLSETVGASTKGSGKLLTD